MSNAVSFDTNLLIRWILQDVPEQAARVITLLKDSDIKEVHIADMAIAEVVWILSSRRVGYSRADVVEVLGIIFKYPKIKYNQTLFEGVLPFYVAHPAISFVDACLAGYANLNTTQLLTFDKKLSRQSKNATLV